MNPSNFSLEIISPTVWTWLWPMLMTGLYISLAVLLHRWITPRLRAIVGRTRTPWNDILYNASGWPFTLLLALGGAVLLFSLWPVRFATKELIFNLTKTAFLLMLVSFGHQFMNFWFRASRPGSWLRIMLLRKMILTAMYGVAAMMLLDIYGYHLSALLTTLGISSLAVAFASQQILSNFFAGLQLSIDRPLEVGQSISLENGMEGEVLTIGWMKTWLRAPDGSRVLVPNSKLTGLIIRNYTLGHRGPAVQVRLPVDRTADLDHAETLAREAALEVTPRNESGALHVDPIVQFIEMTPTAAVLNVTLYALDYKTAWKTRGEFIKAVGRRYNDAGIKLA